MCSNHQILIYVCVFYCGGILLYRFSCFQRFDELDVTGSGTLGQEDIRLLEEAEERRLQGVHQRLSLAASQRGSIVFSPHRESMVRHSMTSLSMSDLPRNSSAGGGGTDNGVGRTSLSSGSSSAAAAAVLAAFNQQQPTATSSNEQGLELNVINPIAVWAAVEDGKSSENAAEVSSGIDSSDQ